MTDQPNEQPTEPASETPAQTKPAPKARIAFLGVALLLVLAMLFALILLYGCGSSEKETEPVVPVQVTPVRRAPITQEINAEAVVFPLQQAIITPKITSTIKQFLVQRGARVHKGELLAVLENADLSAAAEQSKGELEQAEAGYATTTDLSLPQQIQKAQLDLEQAKAALDAAQKLYDSRKELFDQGALPRRDLDSAQVAQIQARGNYQEAQKALADLQRTGEKQTLKSATGQLSAARGKYLGAQAEVGYSEIRSPIDGVVTDRPQYEGELATANQPLLTVMNISRLVAKAHIAQSEAAVLKVNDPATIQIPGANTSTGEPAAPVLARVSLVSPAVDPGSTTIEVWVESNSANAALKPGITVQLSITARSVPDALVIPASAVFKDDAGKDFVMLAGSDGLAHASNIQIGVRNAQLVQIASGLKENDSVITSGGYALPDKTKIKVESAASEAPANKNNQQKDQDE
jgi:RND family efflux transporter MFP subunit